jgi:uncharacterized membrane protein YdjX (TVP38/TMEM64 family)
MCHRLESRIMRDSAAKGRGDRVARLEWIVLGFALFGLALALRSLPVRASLEKATLWIESLGWWAPAAFLVLYVICTLLLVPRTVLTVGAGFLFGPLWGLLLALGAINLGANLAFALGRHFARGAVERRIRDHGRIRSLERAVACGGWRFVALTRLSPVFPYSLLNYAFGLTRVPWVAFTAGSFAGMFPGTLLLVILGSLTDFAAERSGSHPGPWVNVLLAIIVAIALVATWIVSRLAKRVLDRHRGESTGDPPDSPPA